MKQWDRWMEQDPWLPLNGFDATETATEFSGHNSPWGSTFCLPHLFHHLSTSSSLTFLQSAAFSVQLLVMSPTTSSAASIEKMAKRRSDPMDDPGRNVAFQPRSRQATHRSLDLDDYFSGPRDTQKHSKWPFFMQLHGSVLPKMFLPLFFVGGWAAAITAIHVEVHTLAVNTVLLTVLGFVVGLALSFRCSTAYERYNDGRKYWSQLSLTSRNLARLIWIHAEERHGTGEGKGDLLAKLTAINLVNAFACSLKHRLRFEPAADYPDLEPYVSHLGNAMAVNADQDVLHAKKPTIVKVTGERLGVSFAQSNPRKLLKKSKDNLGNLPLEILTYLQSFTAGVIDNKTLNLGGAQIGIMNDIRSLADVLAGCERILNTPLPIAYSISISQITWAYIVVLPFQLVGTLEWITIPASMIAAYIILGLAIIGREIENPFGSDVNDLPLDEYCRELAADLDVLTSSPAPRMEDFIQNKQNRVLFPLSVTEYEGWENKEIEDIRDALRAKATSKARSVQIERVQRIIQTEEMTGDLEAAG